jgi:predicted transposase/invertase (TIGR01784 family)
LIIKGLPDLALLYHRGEIRLASELLSTMSEDPNEIAQYLSRRRYERDQAHNRAVLRDEGRAEGKAEGRAEGRAEVAKNALLKQISIDDIIEITGLSRAEIEALR